MLSAFRYRLYPKTDQEKRLNRSLILLCGLYNDLKAEEMRRYRKDHKSTPKTMFRTFALNARKHDERLRDIHSQVVQNVGDRIHRSFRNFFEGRARFPKWKKPNRYNSLTFTQFGFRLNPEKGLLLFGLGYVRIFVHRPLLGRVKQLTIKHEADDKWCAIFITERDEPTGRPLTEIPITKIRGADMGLSSFVTFDDSTSAEYPEFLRRSEGKIARLQRHFMRKHKGSRRRRELGRRLARLHLHVGHQREDFQNKLVHRIFSENDVLVLEKLHISGMLRNHLLAKSISDASWNSFAKKASFKAKSMGKHLIFVDSWGTTQLCHNCLGWVPKALGERKHRCLSCGIDVPRDENSALLIKRLGILRSPTPDRGPSPAEQRPLPSLREVVSQRREAGSLPTQG
ncbi:MAG: transposase [Thaumarchaeota archaeon]|nr:transposase [Nitrososphaerota archaeon]